MVLGTLPTTRPISSVFFGRDILRVRPVDYNLTIRKIIRNLKVLPESIIHDLANIHDKETGRVLQEANLRPEARTALISHIDIKDINSTNLKIISMSDIGAFFEFGVREHEVLRDFTKISGGSVGDWMDEHAFPEGTRSFVVGKPGTILDKNNPLMFMGKGYEKSWKNAPRVTTKFIKQI